MVHQVRHQGQQGGMGLVISGRVEVQRSGMVALALLFTGMTWIGAGGRCGEAVGGAVVGGEGSWWGGGATEGGGMVGRRWNRGYGQGRGVLGKWEAGTGASGKGVGEAGAGGR